MNGVNGTSAPMKRKLIVDTDSGGDDAVALMLAFSCSDVEVEAITTCWGNVSVHQATENVGKLLDFYGIDVPLYKGAEGPLLGARETVAWEGYGKDGYGDAGFPTPLHQPTSPMPACLMLVQHLQKVRPYSETGEVVQLVVLGPCTNLALALKLDKTLCNNLGGGGYPGLVLMGGAYEAKGNSNMAAEFNFHCDPEAAHIVFGTVNTPIHLVAWELCVACPVTWEWFDSWLGRGGRQNRVQVFYERLFKRLEEFTRPSEEGAPPDTGDDPITQDETCVIPDAVAMVAALEPAFIEESFETFCTVELWGRETRGMTVLDWYGTEASMKKAERWKNCVLITAVNSGLFLRHLGSIISHHYVNEPAHRSDDTSALFEPGRRRSKVCSNA